MVTLPNLFVTLDKATVSKVAMLLSRGKKNNHRVSFTDPLMLKGSSQLLTFWIQKLGGEKV